MDEILNGAISVRVSTDMQTKYSPDSQIKICLKYAKEHNISVSEEHIYRDDGISGKYASKRNDFQRMIADAKTNPKPFDVILVYDFSRFARNKEESVMYKGMLRKKYNIDVISVTQPLGDGKERVILESMYEAMDEYYILNLSENVKRGKEEKASRGEYQGGPVLGYDYDKNTEQLYINKLEADNIKFIHTEWNKPDTTLCGEVTLLNELGITTKRGGKWCTSSLIYVLSNPLYIGYIRYTPGGMTKNFNDPKIQVRKGTHPAILKKSEFKNSIDKLNKHYKKWFKYKKPSVQHEYWLRGLLKCDNCGKNLIMIERKSENKKKPFFQCNGYNKKMCNESHSILQEKLEEALLNQLKIIFTKKMDINIISSKSNNDTINVLKKAINKCNSRLERIKVAYMDGIDSLEEYKEKKNNILAEIDKLNKQLETLNTQEYELTRKDKIYKKCEYAHKILQDNDVDIKIKEQIANELFDKIIYSKKENTLYVYFKEL